MGPYAARRPPEGGDRAGGLSGLPNHGLTVLLGPGALGMEGAQDRVAHRAAGAADPVRAGDAAHEHVLEEGRFAGDHVRHEGAQRAPVRRLLEPVGLHGEAATLEIRRTEVEIRRTI